MDNNFVWVLFKVAEKCFSQMAQMLSQIELISLRLNLPLRLCVKLLLRRDH